MSTQQKVVGELLKKLRLQAPYPLDVSQQDLTHIALELVFVALAMTERNQPAGLLVARRFATIAGLNPDDVESFARFCVSEELAGAR